MEKQIWKSFLADFNQVKCRGNQDQIQAEYLVIVLMPRYQFKMLYMACTFLGNKHSRKYSRTFSLASFLSSFFLKQIYKHFFGKNRVWQKIIRGSYLFQKSRKEIKWQQFKQFV